ncbi:MAG: alpha/beta fold hydrolase [Eubacteriales bacterium]|nr:alpha/beta fold hydrolase [Eubacteriales bacterium]
MTTAQNITYPSATGECTIHATLWLPEGEPRAVLQIAHGMAEHIERYAGFAAFLNENGIAVAANDHAGHGKSIKNEKMLGYFAKEDGWNKVVQDMQTLREIVSDKYPNAPYLMMGHSMGSFLTRTYATKFGSGIRAFIISGTAGSNPVLGVAKIIAKGEIKKNGPIQPSPKLNSLSFGAYNKQFQPARTEFDWLSRDEQQVDLYVADRFCGFMFTAEAMLDLFTGLSGINGKAWAAQVPRVPILLMSGEMDPVGNNGKGVRQVEKWLLETGHDVTCTLYPGGRHEMLNEVNRDEVMEDVLAFINAAL